MLFNQPVIQKCPFREVIFIYMFPGPTRLGILDCIVICSAIFAQLTAESPCTLQYALKHD